MLEPAAAATAAANHAARNRHYHAARYGSMEEALGSFPVVCRWCRSSKMFVFTHNAGDIVDTSVIEVVGIGFRLLRRGSNTATRLAELFAVKLSLGVMLYGRTYVRTSI